MFGVPHLVYGELVHAAVVLHHPHAQARGDRAAHRDQSQNYPFFHHIHVNVKKKKKFRNTFSFCVSGKTTKM